jgi:hypothetical protein
VSGLGESGSDALALEVAAVQRRLTDVYRLELDLRAELYLVEPERARELLPTAGPRTGVLVLEEQDGARLGLYVDPRDRNDPDAIVEETSHLVCLAWHAAQERSVSVLHLELQSEVDRYVVARLEGRDALRHFREFAWASWMDRPTRRRYETAHRAAHRYCLSLERRYRRRCDAPALLLELRRYYRASPERKLRAGERPPRAA